MKLRKRMLAMVLSVVMLISVLPTNVVWATTTEADSLVPNEEESTEQDSDTLPEETQPVEEAKLYY